MVVEVQLEWRNADGQLLGQRTVLWPFAVSTADSYLVYYIIAACVAVVAAIPLLIRHFLRRRKRRRRIAIADEEGEQDYLREPAPEKAMPGPAKKGWLPSRRGQAQGEAPTSQEKPADTGSGPGAPAPAPSAKPTAPSPARGEGMLPPEREQKPGSGDEMLPDYLR
jgi:hypothetical protein